MEPIIYKPGAYKSPGIYKGTGGIYNGRCVYNDGTGGYNVPYYTKFENFNFIELCDNPIIGKKEFVRNHQNLVYSNETILYNGETLNSLKVKEPNNTDFTAPDLFLFFGNNNYRLSFINKIEQNTLHPNFSIWFSFGNNWVGLGTSHGTGVIFILFDNSSYTLFNGAYTHHVSGIYHWVDTNIPETSAFKISIEAILNKVKFKFNDVLLAECEFNDVFMNGLNFSPRYNKSFWITELKAEWI